MTYTQRPAPRVVIGPAVEPITVAQARAHCNITSTDDDGLLALYIAAAREACEHATGRALITQTLELAFDAFPAGAIELARPPIASITSITYIDQNAQEQTVNQSLYVLDSRADPGFVIPAYSASWPVALDTANAVVVRYVAGYGADGSAVPAPLREWMLVYVATMYRNREAFVEGRQVADLPGRFVDGLLDKYVVWSA